jgi:hypothetical protein
MKGEIVMKKTFFMILLLIGLGAFFSIAATSYFTESYYFPLGSVIHLFQSGTQEIRKEISVHDTLTVFRPGESCEFEEVGRIEVVSFSGRYYLLGKIIAGKIITGDIAKKGSIACIIITPDWMCKK